MNNKNSRLGNKNIRVAAIITASICSFSTFATQYVFTGQIDRLSSSASEAQTPAENISTVRLTSTTLSAGSCALGSSNYLPMNIRNDVTGERMYYTLLAAQLAGHSVQVTVDDSVKNSNNVCYLLRARIEM